MYSGLLNDGSLLFGCWALNRIYRVAPKDGRYMVFRDFPDAGQAMSVGKISPDGAFLATVAAKTKKEGNQLVSVRNDFLIWEILPDNSIKKIYSEEIIKKEMLSGWTWARQNHIVKVTTDEANRYKLWRYDIVQDKVSLTNIPVDGLKGGQNRISVSNFFIGTYGPRLWDVESGTKITPWYEAFDPFDESNRLPLYDQKPAVVHIRDFWRN